MGVIRKMQFKFQRLYTKIIKLKIKIKVFIINKYFYKFNESSIKLSYVQNISW